MKFTEQMCKDIGITLGMSEDKSLAFFHHYNAQDWFFGSGLKITNLKSAMWRWKNSGYKEKDGKKTKLYPIRGKHCSEKGCGMPAVYKWTSDSDYDFWYCMEHIPRHIREKVKAEYE